MPRAKKVTEEPAAAAQAAEEVKETEKKETAKKPAARKTAAKKTEAAETEKEAVKAEPVKKAPAKKAAKKAEPEVTVTIQFKGKDVVAKEVLAAKKAYAEANPDAEIKTIDIYVKPEENVAYYAVNGEGSEDYKIQL